MSSYTPKKLTLSTSLDEAALEVSQFRDADESLADFRDRLLEELRDPSGSTEQDFLRTVGRKALSRNQEIFEIDLITVNDIPVAPDPRIIVTATKFMAYSDYANGTIDAEVNLTAADGRWARDIYNAFSTSTVFTITAIDPNYTYLDSQNFMICDNEKIVTNEPLVPSRENKLAHNYIVSIGSDRAALLSTEKASRNLVTAEGDYYVDYTNGVLLTYSAGRGTVAYRYREFPFRLVWQTIRAIPLRDETLDAVMYDVITDHETGLPINVLLNQKGAEYYNAVLNVTPMTWGR